MVNKNHPTWDRYTVQDFIDRGEAKLKTGPFGTQLHASDYVDEGTPVINVRNIGYGKLKDANLEYLDDETVDRLSGHLLETDDIVFGRKGAHDRHVFIKPELSGWFQGSDCLRLRIKSNLAEPRFLSYYFLTSRHIRWMYNMCSFGVTMSSLNQDIVKRIPIILPPLPTQKRIAEILGALDDKIETNRRINRVLEQMAQALFKHWFVDFGPFQDGCFVDSKLGRIPDGWSVRKLGELCHKPQYGYTASAQEEPVGPKFLRITDINKLPWIEWENVPHCEISDEDRIKYRVKQGDFLIARMADPGHAVLIEEDVDAVFASYLIRFVPKDSRYWRYLQYWQRSYYYWGIINSYKIGTTRPSLNAKVLSSFMLIVPPFNVLEKFSEAVNTWREMVVANVKENHTLAQTRDYLLPKLLSGEVEVKL